MSKRHNTSRRRSYGRRQHELHERIDRRTDRRQDRPWREGHELEPAAWGSPSPDVTFGFAD
ncbi:MAG TPA: hypothetical protein VFP56_05475 [Candidatus Limnocylindrales bacterium]|nr:hypothetical protein [Candidatus Limnocylindrales bacterium]